jgi:hypothetical protein
VDTLSRPHGYLGTVVSPGSKSLKRIDGTSECDLLIAFADDFNDVSAGGARFWETGFANAKNIETWVVGNVPQILFHWLPGIVHLPDANSVLARLGQTNK